MNQQQLLNTSDMVAQAMEVVEIHTKKSANYTKNGEKHYKKINLPRLNLWKNVGFSLFFVWFCEFILKQYPRYTELLKTTENTKISFNENTPYHYNL